MQNNTFEIASLIAVIIGVLLGVFLPEGAVYIAFLGKIFLALLKMLILPIIILSLFLAVGKISSAQNLKSIGFKTIGYYFSTSALAVMTGLIVANIFIFKETAESIAIDKVNTEINLVERIFSTNIFNSLAEGEILHIVVFIILFSIAFTTLETAKRAPVIKVSESLFEVVMKLLEWILKLAPIGILSLVWTTVSGFNADTFSSLTNFFIATSIAITIHACVTLPLVGRLVGKFNPIEYFWKVKQAVVVAFATASSAATIPVSTKVVEASGASKEVSRFVIPIGATLNMDGSALYQALLAMLFVVLSGTDISLGGQFLIFVLILLSSAGTAGIPSGGIVMMTMVINTLGIENPDYYLGLYIMVDRFWDYLTTAVNVWGDLIGAKTVDGLVK